MNFARTISKSPVSSSRRTEILLDPCFGKFHTDHMVSIKWNREAGWHEAAVIPYSAISIEPSALIFHYAQGAFEGLKAFTQPDGSASVFRADMHAERFARSCRRMAIPELPCETFIESLRELIAIDYQWLPPADSGQTLYLRPFTFATEACLSMRPSTEYRYMVLASPGGMFFSDAEPVSVWASEDYVRAAPGGTGGCKTGGNYAAAFMAQAEAIENGCDQVLWLDAIERRFIEELGGMNVFFVLSHDGETRLVTPALTGALLPGVTRLSLLQLASDAGYDVEERRIDLGELKAKAASGELLEMFACGTAASVTPIALVKSASGEFQVGDGRPGRVTTALRDVLTGIQRGTFADIHGWMYRM